MKRALRDRVRVSYYEPEEPSFDEYVFCSICGDYVFEYCSIHGQLLIIPDNEIFDRDHKPAHIIDARDPNKSNWMRYVNCSRHHSEQSLVAYQYQGQLYYRTIKVVPRFTELLVFYGSQFASRLNIDIRRYHAPVYADILVNAQNGVHKGESHSKVNGDVSIVEVKEDASQIPITQEFTNESNCETKLPSEITSEKELDDLNKNIDETKDQNKINCDSHVCNYCLQTFKEKAALTEHMTTHNTVKNVDYKTTNKSRYLCLICNCKFSTKSKLINHEIQMHDSKIEYIACSQCEYKTLLSRCFKAHVKTHNKYAQNICQICGLKFKDINRLMIHFKFHDTNKQFACTICGYRFKTHYEVKRHAVCHSEEKPFKCSTCNKSFPRNSSLRKHEKLHKTSSAVVIDLGGPSMS